MDKIGYNNKIIDDAVEVLRDDGVILVATDTVYGLMVSSQSEAGKKKIYEIKQRDLGRRLPVVVESYERLISLANINERKIKIIKKLLPGKITVVLNKKGSTVEEFAARMMDNEIFNKIIEKLDTHVLLTSANISNEPMPSNLDDLIELFDGKVDMIILGNEKGDKIGNVPSTIIDMTKDVITCQREGAVPFSKIQKIIDEIE